jgi:ATP phosphoribosyltransferase regulatory subunit
VARIARTRLANATRPLRLAYAGAILHVRPNSLASERQLYQAGFELIGAKTGANAWESDAEVMLVAAESLLRLGIKGLSLDINLPGLVSYIISSSPEVISEAIRRKDAAALPAGYPHREAVAALLQAAGPAKKALAAMQQKSTPSSIREEAQKIEPLIAQLGKWLPEVSLTLDPLEHKGFEYHQGVSFSLFAAGLRQEAGRGGRYALEDGREATGFTLDVTTLLPLVPPSPERPRKTLPVTASIEDIRQAQKENIVILD